MTMKDIMMGFAFKDKNSYGTTAGERNLLVNQTKMSLWRPPASLKDEVVMNIFRHRTPLYSL